jgi:hypothetical protein
VDGLAEEFGRVYAAAVQVGNGRDAQIVCGPNACSVAAQAPACRLRDAESSDSTSICLIFFCRCRAIVSQSVSQLVSQNFSARLGAEEPYPSLANLSSLFSATPKRRLPPVGPTSEVGSPSILHLLSVMSRGSAPKGGAVAALQRASPDQRVQQPQVLDPVLLPVELREGGMSPGRAQLTISRKWQDRTVSLTMGALVMSKAR